MIVGQWLSNCWPMVGQWLANGCPTVGQRLANGWRMAGQWLANALPMVCQWLANGSPWFANGRAMVGPWLADCWPMVGQWLAKGLPMVGQWLANGWPMVGQWLANGWGMAGQPSILTNRQFRPTVSFGQSLILANCRFAGPERCCPWRDIFKPNNFTIGLFQAQQFCNRISGGLLGFPFLLSPFLGYSPLLFSGFFLGFFFTFLLFLGFFLGILFYFFTLLLFLWFLLGILFYFFTFCRLAFSENFWSQTTRAVFALLKSLDLWVTLNNVTFILVNFSESRLCVKIETTRIFLRYWNP